MRATDSSIVCSPSARACSTSSVSTRSAGRIRTERPSASGSRSSSSGTPSTFRFERNSSSLESSAIVMSRSLATSGVRARPSSIPVAATWTRVAPQNAMPSQSTTPTAPSTSTRRKRSIWRSDPRPASLPRAVQPQRAGGEVELAAARRRPQAPFGPAWFAGAVGPGDVLERGRHRAGAAARRRPVCPPEAPRSHRGGRSRAPVATGRPDWGHDGRRDRDRRGGHRGVHHAP